MTKITDIDKKLAEVVLEAYRKGFTVQSDYARSGADFIAMASSIGLISTRLHSNVYSREWRPTIKGLEWLEDTFGIEIETDDSYDEGHD